MPRIDHHGDVLGFIGYTARYPIGVTIQHLASFGARVNIFCGGNHTLKDEEGNITPSSTWWAGPMEGMPVCQKCQAEFAKRFGQPWDPEIKRG